ncbi:hypothetical protein F5I97DRAFT_2057369 [Phlebopus sp. FC_14]|nr:hypothetical protein F5I97DRAFT_2057369 [Phlebopus sp. FC_14]
MSTDSFPSAQLLAAAAIRRSETSGSSSSDVQSLQELEQRQKFRRLIDPGIFRPNSKDKAMASLRTLLTIAENLLRDPDNPIYQQFKPTNDKIQRCLVEPKGALEYAIALGFRPNVKDFQPYYVFDPRKMTDLRIGATILKEAIDLETQKQERSERSKIEAKAVAAAAAQNASILQCVKLAFLDDRKSKMLRDQRERALREVREERGAGQAPISTTGPSPLSPSMNPMPGTGNTFASAEPSVDDPPPYAD